VAEDWGYQTDREVIDALLDVDGKFIVDAGCGDGDLCRHLAGCGARVLGIEPNPIQAEKNSQAAVVENVGFAQTGAGKIPLEPHSVDGIIFKNSLHHVYAPDFEQVFKEVARVMNGSGFLCVVEPIANGSFQYVMELFHDETKVRHGAYKALVQYAMPVFGSMREIYYDVDSTYNSFDDFAKRFEKMSFNNYTGEIRQAEVERRFIDCENSHGTYTLTQPMRVNFFTQIKQ